MPSRDYLRPVPFKRLSDETYADKDGDKVEKWTGRQPRDIVWIAAVSPRELLRHRTFVFHLHEYTSSYKLPVKVEKWVLNKDLVF